MTGRASGPGRQRRAVLTPGAVAAWTIAIVGGFAAPARALPSDAGAPVALPGAGAGAAVAAPVRGIAAPPVGATAAAVGGGATLDGAAAGENVDLDADVEDPLTVQVLTFGPGSHPFTRFGHDAIRIIDRQARTDIVYNFGTFTFDSPWLIVDFLRGRLRYWLSRASMTGTVRGYRHDNRDIEAQELNLTPAEKRELLDRLVVNARPENRDYRYDYFADNCSTRVRDALDVVLRGRLRAAAGGQGSMSLRAHALRMAADDLPLYTALLIVLGPRTDGPTDEWAETFLPEMLQRSLRRVSVTGESWTVAPLVKAESVLFKADRAPAARQPPSHWPGFLAVGVIIGAILWLSGRARPRSRAVRVLFGALTAVIGLVAGLVGCFLVGTWAFTPHAVAYGNQNSLLFAPFAIALTPLGLAVAVGRSGAVRKTFWLGAAAVASAIVAVALKLSPAPTQDNAALIALMLPVWVGLTTGARAAWGAWPPPRAITVQR